MSASSSTGPHTLAESDDDSEFEILGAADLHVRDENPNDIPLRDLEQAEKRKESLDVKPHEYDSPVDGGEDEQRDALDDPLDGIIMTDQENHSLFTHHEENAVISKLDKKLVLFLALLYLLSFLDRSNIGNAELAGLKHDLRLSDDQYRYLVQGFYVTYILFEWMTLLYRVFPAHIYVSLCVGAWGLIASLQSNTSAFPSMLVCRLLLGISEAAFSPGVPFYLSFFYRRDELAYRTGLFISAAPLASTFASTLAYGVMRLGGTSNTSGSFYIQGWRLLFLVEGFPSLLVAIFAWFWIPDSPGTACWLTEREQQVATLRLQDRSGHRSAKITDHPGLRERKRVDFSEIGKTLRDPKAYLTAAMFLSANIAFSSMPVFSPILIRAMGYPNIVAQGLSALPHLFAFPTVLLASSLSDRLRLRSWIIVLASSSAAIGYVLLACVPFLNIPHALRYACLFPVTAGFFTAVTLTIVWTMDNQSSETGKGTGVAVLNFIGQLGPLVGTGLYPEKDAPYFVWGHAVCAISMASVAVLAIVLRSVLKAANARSAREARYAIVGRATPMREERYIL